MARKATKAPIEAESGKTCLTVASRTPKPPGTWVTSTAMFANTKAVTV